MICVVAGVAGILFSFILRFSPFFQSVSYLSGLLNLIQLACSSLLAYYLYLRHRDKFRKPKFEKRFELVGIVAIVIAVYISFRFPDSILQWLAEMVVSISMGIWFSVIDLLEGKKNRRAIQRK